MTRLLLAALALSGCLTLDGPTPPGGCPTCGDDGVEDRTRVWPDSGYEPGWRIETPAFEIPAGEERILCYSTVWEGPDVGVTSLIPWFDTEVGHHSLIKVLPLDAPYPLGEVFDCSGQDFQPPPPTLFEAVGIESVETPSQDWLVLPEGTAMLLRSGQRILVDMHFLNFQDRPVRVNNVFELEFLDADSVTQWAAAWNNDAGTLGVPPGADATIRFTCPWEQSVSLLSVGAHMHGYGTMFRVDLVRADGSEELLLDVPVWEEDFRSHPPIRSFADGGVAVEVGDRLRTTCGYRNTTDHELDFPDEMCTSYGAAVPLLESLHCEGADTERLFE